MREKKSFEYTNQTYSPFSLSLNVVLLQNQNYHKIKYSFLPFFHPTIFFSIQVSQPARPLTSADFQAMIPAHFITGTKNEMHVETKSITNSEHGSGGTGNTASVIVTVNKNLPDMPMLPPAPTELGRVTETITKSTLTETVMTRVTDNRLAEPLISEVNIFC